MRVNAAGAIALTAMPSAAPAVARLRVSPITPPLAVAYDRLPASPKIPDDVVITIAAVAPLDQVRPGGAGGEERAVHVHAPVPGQRLLVDVRHALPADDAGVVDQDVDGPEPLDRRIDERAGAVRVRDVARVAIASPPAATISPATVAATSASAPSPSIELPTSLTTTCAPRAREQVRVRATDAPPRSGDDRDAAVEAELRRGQLATGASKPRRSPSVPPTIAARSSSGTPAISRASSSRLPAERALGVRVVVAPDDRGQAGDVPARDRDRVVLERDVELALHVLARHQRVRPLLVELEQARHVRLVGRRPGLVPVAEPPVRVLPDPGDPALVHRARRATRASAR